ncbi:HD domain-containing protein 2, partial [Reticulomyxa filosa]
MYRMGMLAWLIGDCKKRENKEVNTVKMMKMALVHDLIESIAGDIVPIEAVSGVTKKEKQEIELSALKKIQSEFLHHSEMANEIYDLWMEFEQQDTKEAQIVRDLDKLDM